ncbi:hypothetical protein J6590_072130 [Homalodisca vitripennis]|nr:hypothetical protein J6590_072130 [Homalodisca vitripennis]
MFAIKCTDAIRALHDSPQICQDEDVLDEPPAEDTINDREAEKSATIIVLESSAGLPEKFQMYLRNQNQAVGNAKAHVL